MLEEQQKLTSLSKRRLLASLLILIVIPFTIWVGYAFFDDRKYYLISILIVVYSMLPFFLVFEKRKPQARELVIIAVFTAIAVSGRAAFFMAPQFKPSLAIVIIAGVAFGCESGFLVGAMTAFVSNFFFGQGPWTPWQMFCLGIIGFLAGLLFQKGRLPQKRLPLCLFGVITAFLIYGGIMNPSTLLMSTSTITWDSLKLVYLTGLTFDAIHAAATAFFLFILAKPMLEKCNRIKIKYGLLET